MSWISPRQASWPTATRRPAAARSSRSTPSPPPCASGSVAQATLELRGQHDGGARSGDAGHAVEPADDLLETRDVRHGHLGHEGLLARDEPAVLDGGDRLEVCGDRFGVALVGDEDTDERAHRLAE